MLRSLPAEHHDPGESRQRLHLGHQRQRWSVPGLGGRPERLDDQLVLHDPVQPVSRQLLFIVRATDDQRSTTPPTTSRLTSTRRSPGPGTWTTTMAFTAPADESLAVTFAGTATDDHGVESVRVGLRDGDTGRYLQPNGTMAAAFATLDAALDSPGAPTTGWSLGVTLRSRAPAFSAVGVRLLGNRSLTTEPRRATVPTRTTVPRRCRRPWGSRRARVVLRRQDRRHRPGRGRAGPERQHRPGRGGGRQLVRSVHELDGRIHQHDGELPHGVPQQPGQRGSNYSYTTWSSRPGPTASSSVRSTCASRSSPHRHRRRSHPAAERATGRRLQLHLRPERARSTDVRRPTRTPAR